MGIIQDINEIQRKFQTIFQSLKTNQNESSLFKKGKGTKDQWSILDDLKLQLGTENYNISKGKIPVKGKQ